MFQISIDLIWQPGEGCKYIKEWSSLKKKCKQKNPHLIFMEFKCVRKSPLPFLYVYISPFWDTKSCCSTPVPFRNFSVLNNRRCLSFTGLQLTGLWLLQKRDKPRDFYCHFFCCLHKWPITLVWLCWRMDS